MIKRTSREWDQIISRWKKSDLSMATYCRENEINYWSFRDNVKKRTSSVSKSDLNTPLVKITPPSTQQDKAGKNAITVYISEKIRLQIPDGFSTDTFRKIIDVLGDGL